MATGSTGATPVVFGRTVMSEQQVNEATVNEAAAAVEDAAAVEAETAAPVAATETTPETTPEAAPEAVSEATPEASAAPAPSDAEEPADEGETGAVDANGTVVRMLSVGQQVKGTVKRITEFGAFVDIGVGRDGLVHISELSAKRVGKVSDVLQEGQEVTLWIKKLDRDRNRISLTMIEPGSRAATSARKSAVR